MNILNLSKDVLIEEKIVAVKLVATRCLVKFSRKLPSEALVVFQKEKFEPILEQLTILLDTSNLDCIHLPVEVFAQYSKVNEEIVAQMAPVITPKLLKLFKTYHNEGQLI
jgi:hypothetical protein